MGILDSNKKTTPAEKNPLVTDAYGPPFDEPWEYASFVGILIYLFGKSRPGIQFAMHQCASFTHNKRRIRAESVNIISRYLFGTQGQGLTFYPNSDMKLYWYVDVDFE